MSKIMSYPTTSNARLAGLFPGELPAAAVQEGPHHPHDPSVPPTTSSNSTATSGTSVTSNNTSLLVKLVTSIEKLSSQVTSTEVGSGGGVGDSSLNGSTSLTTTTPTNVVPGDPPSDPSSTTTAGTAAPRPSRSSSLRPPPTPGSNTNNNNTTDNAFATCNNLTAAANNNNNSTNLKEALDVFLKECSDACTSYVDRQNRHFPGSTRFSSSRSTNGGGVAAGPSSTTFGGGGTGGGGGGSSITKRRRGTIFAEARAMATYNIDSTPLVSFNQGRQSPQSAASFAIPHNNNNNHSSFFSTTGSAGTGNNSPQPRDASLSQEHITATPPSYPHHHHGSHHSGMGSSSGGRHGLPSGQSFGPMSISGVYSGAPSNMQSSRFQSSHYHMSGSRLLMGQDSTVSPDANAVPLVAVHNPAAIELSPSSSVASVLRPPVQHTAQLRKTRDFDGSKMINNYLVLDELGRGSFGKVKLGFDTIDERLVAIKILKRNKYINRLDSVGGMEMSQILAGVEVSSVDGSPQQHHEPDNGGDIGGATTIPATPHPPPPHPKEEKGGMEEEEDDIDHDAEAKLAIMRKQQQNKKGGAKFRRVSLVEKAQAKAIEQEVDVMKRVRHPNLVALFEVIDDPDEDKLYLVMQYVDDGVLASVPDPDDLIDVKSHPQLATAQGFLGACKQICTGLEYLHTHRIVHRDLKPENILVGKDGTLCIADFGVSSSLADDTAVEGMGTKLFMAPELLDETRRASIMPSFDEAESLLFASSGSVRPSATGEQFLSVTGSGFGGGGDGGEASSRTTCASTPTASLSVTVPDLQAFPDRDRILPNRRRSQQVVMLDTTNLDGSPTTFLSQQQQMQSSLNNDPASPIRPIPATPINSEVRNVYGRRLKYATDMWALGVTIYFLLYRKLPFTTLEEAKAGRVSFPAPDDTWWLNTGGTISGATSECSPAPGTLHSHNSGGCQSSSRSLLTGSSSGGITAVSSEELAAREHLLPAMEKLLRRMLDIDPSKRITANAAKVRIKRLMRDIEDVMDDALAGRGLLSDSPVRSTPTTTSPQVAPSTPQSTKFDQFKQHQQGNSHTRGSGVTRRSANNVIGWKLDEDDHHDDDDGAGGAGILSHKLAHATTTTSPRHASHHNLSDIPQYQSMAMEDPMWSSMDKMDKLTAALSSVGKLNSLRALGGGGRGSGSGSGMMMNNGRDHNGDYNSNNGRDHNNNNNDGTNSENGAFSSTPVVSETVSRQHSGTSAQLNQEQQYHHSTAGSGFRRSTASWRTDEIAINEASISTEAVMMPQTSAESYHTTTTEKDPHTIIRRQSTNQPATSSTTSSQRDITDPHNDLGGEDASSSSSSDDEGEAKMAAISGFVAFANTPSSSTPINSSSSGNPLLRTPIEGAAVGGHSKTTKTTTDVGVSGNGNGGDAVGFDDGNHNNKLSAMSSAMYSTSSDHRRDLGSNNGEGGGQHSSGGGGGGSDLVSCPSTQVPNTPPHMLTPQSSLALHGSSSSLSEQPSISTIVGGGDSSSTANNFHVVVPTVTTAPTTTLSSSAVPVIPSPSSSSSSRPFSHYSQHTNAKPRISSMTAFPAASSPVATNTTPLSPPPPPPPSDPTTLTNGGPPKRGLRAVSGLGGSSNSGRGTPGAPGPYTVLGGNASLSSSSQHQQHQPYSGLHHLRTIPSLSSTEERINGGGGAHNYTNNNNNNSLHSSTTTTPPAPVLYTGRLRAYPPPSTTTVIHQLPATYTSNHQPPTIHYLHQQQHQPPAPLQTRLKSWSHQPGTSSSPLLQSSNDGTGSSSSPRNRHSLPTLSTPHGAIRCASSLATTSPSVTEQTTTTTTNNNSVSGSTLSSSIGGVGGRVNHFRIYNDAPTQPPPSSPLYSSLRRLPTTNNNNNNTKTTTNSTTSATPISTSTEHNN